jgi:hypothetical protein
MASKKLKKVLMAGLAGAALAGAAKMKGKALKSSVIGSHGVASGSEMENDRSYLSKVNEFSNVTKKENVTSNELLIQTYVWSWRNGWC